MFGVDGPPGAGRRGRGAGAGACWPEGLAVGVGALRNLLQHLPQNRVAFCIVCISHYDMCFSTCPPSRRLTSPRACAHPGRARYKDGARAHSRTQTHVHTQECARACTHRAQSRARMDADMTRRAHRTAAGGPSRRTRRAAAASPAAQRRRFAALGPGPWRRTYEARPVAGPDLSRRSWACGRRATPLCTIHGARPCPQAPPPLSPSRSGCGHSEPRRAARPTGLAKPAYHGPACGGGRGGGPVCGASGWGPGCPAPAGPRPTRHGLWSRNRGARALR